MNINFSKIVDDQIVQLSHDEVEWDNIFFVKDKKRNEQLKNFFFNSGNKKILTQFENYSSINLVLDNDRFYLLKIKNDMPYLEEI